MNASRRVRAWLCMAAMLLMLTACAGTGTGTGTGAETGAADTEKAETAVAENENGENGEDSEETESGNADTASDAALENGTVPWVDNDTVTLGELERYDPAKRAEVDAGEAIEGNAEEELQQERIAGGAVGAVVSENLEPLTGLTDPPEGDYTPVYGVDGQ